MFSNKNFIILLTLSLLLPSVALGFIGPSAGQSPGSGGGALQLDAARNLGFGTSSSTPVSSFDSTSTNSGYPANFGYVYMVASTTNPGIGLKNLTSGNVWLWSARNFGPLQLFRESATLAGLVVMEIDEFGNIGVSTRATTTARFKVGGNVETTGSFVGALSGALSAANVSSDVFGRLQGNGNFAFPASVGFATSSKDGLPQTLSVYGNGYVSGGLGIGTTSQLGKLYVVGSGGGASTVVLGNEDNIAFKRADGVTVYGIGHESGTFKIGSNTTRSDVAAGTPIQINSGGSYTTFYTAGSERVRITPTGSVGIGTTAPTSTLTVNGDIAFYGGELIFSDAGVNNRDYIIYNDVGWGTSAGTYTFAADTALGAASSSPTAAISAEDAYFSGNVGIGAASPGDKLEVAGNIRLTSAGNVYLRGGKLQIESSDNLGSYYIWNAGSGGTDKIVFDTSAAGSGQVVFDNGGNVGIGDTTPTEGTLTVGGTGYFTGTVTVGTPTADSHAATKSYVDSTVGGGGTAGSFNTLTVSGTSTLATTQGNVGIGTTGPVDKLDVVGGSTRLSSYLRMRDFDTGNYNGTTEGTTLISRDFTTMFWQGGVVIGQYNNDAVPATYSANGAFLTTGPVALAVSTGNVGIGTTAPGNLLEVNTDTAGKGYLLYDSVSARKIAELYRGSSSNDPGVFELYNAGSVTVRINGEANANSYFNTGGNVGIATTSPAYALHVYGTGAFSQPLIVGTPTQASHAATKSYVDSISSGSTGVWLLSGSNLYASSTSWNVGVGLTSPAVKFEAAGPIRSSRSGVAGQYVQLDGGDAASYRITAQSILAAEKPLVIQNLSAEATPGASNYIQFRVGNTTTTTAVLTIASSSNVGIGTASPTGKLTVTGPTVNNGEDENSEILLVGPDPQIKFDDNGSDNAWLHLNSGLFYVLGGTNTWDSGRPFVVDLTNERVGINNTSPSYSLDVTGTAQFTQPVIVGTPTADSHAATKSYVDSTVGGGAATSSFSTITVSGTSTFATTQGNVGIGTASPGTRLEVGANAASNEVITVKSGGRAGLELIGDTDNDVGEIGTGYIIFSQDNAAVQSIIGQTQGAGQDSLGNTVTDSLANSLLLGVAYDSNSESQAALQFFTNPSTRTVRMTITNAGNVGIATTSPAYALHVYGTGAFSQPLIVGTPTQASHAATKSYVDSISAGSSGVWLLSGSNLYASSTSWNVGIGTTGPQHLLHAARSSVGDVVSFLVENTDNTNSGSGARNMVYVAGSSAGDPRFVAGITGIKEWSLGIDNDDGDKFKIGEDSVVGTNTRLTIDVGGNVGIGTTSPGRNLHIAGTSTIGIRFTYTGGATSDVLYSTGADANGMRLLIDGGGPLIIGGGEAAANINTNVAVSGEELYLASDNTGTSRAINLITGMQSGWASRVEAVTVLGNGSVGILDTTPSYTLDVTGTGQFTQPVIVGTPTTASHATTKSYVDSAISGVSSTQFWVLSGTDLYASSTSWDVGIGTTAPDSRLQVGGQIRLGLVTNGATTTTSEGNRFYVSGAGDVSDTWDSDNSDPIWFARYNAGQDQSQLRINVGDGSDVNDRIDLGTSLSGTFTPRFAVRADGNVGIGTTAPDELFHASTSAAGTGAHIGNAFVGVWDGGTTYAAFTHDSVKTTSASYALLHGSSGQTYINAASGQEITFRIGNVDNSGMIIKSDGDVGIATTTPAYKLHVYGTGAFSQPLIVGTPTQASHAATKSYVDSSITGGTTANANACNADATCEMNGATLNNGNITGVNKLTVTTIDPLYQIGFNKYSTYAASIVGGVKEEFVGKAKLAAISNDEFRISNQLSNDSKLKIQNSELTEPSHEYVIDFNKVKEGSDLWVWRKAVDFSRDNVDVFITPYGASANIYYVIENNKIIFRGDKSAEFSYRLIGKRFDWRNWPTFAKDQNEIPSFIIND
ncbi:MAG TPA: hypothetical protein VNK70_01590 [Candidatus Paceibacterota bacterium]|nr:hypothetical protein [Candidatus Paceibacterota bacterium]